MKLNGQTRGIYGLVDMEYQWKVFNHLFACISFFLVGISFPHVPTRCHAVTLSISLRPGDMFSAHFIHYTAFSANFFVGLAAIALSIAALQYLCMQVNKMFEVKSAGWCFVRSICSSLRENSQLCKLVFTSLSFRFPSLSPSLPHSRSSLHQSIWRGFRLHADNRCPKKCTI